MSYENATMPSGGTAGANMRETRETEAVLNRILNLNSRLTEANNILAETEGRLVGCYPVPDGPPKDAPVQSSMFGQINDALDYLEGQVRDAQDRAGRMSRI